MSRICTQCNHDNRDVARFCSVCGTSLIQSGAIGVSAVQAGGNSYLGGSKTGLLPANTRLAGRYLIQKKIGQGGMGAVYQARDVRLPNKVWAIKEMSGSAVIDQAEMQRIVRDFQREARILASLDHPNIPKVVDSFNEGGRYYLVMEYVTGDTLEALLTRRGQPFEEREVRHWSDQLCNALAYLHRCSPPIIFRDLKPDNIMLSKSGQIKLIDFGIARLLKPGKKDTTLLGTFGYAAPEQYQGQTGPHSDIYALGVTLHQLLTGYDPTTEPLKPLPSVRQLNPAISEAMEKVITRSLAKVPNKRWQSVGEMQGVLQGSQPLQGGGARASSGHLMKQMPTKAVGKPSTSRPTTRLLLAVNKLSNEQLAMALSGTVVVVILSVWGLAPLIQKHLPVVWNNVPTFALAGPFAYAALQRRGSAILVHIPITIVFWLTLWTRMGYMIQGEPLVLSTLLSGLALEAGLHYLPQIKANSAHDAWQREIAWFAAVTIATAVSFYLALSILGEGYATTPYYARLGVWIGAAMLGGLAWFLGDLVQQWIQMRQTGSP